MISIYYAITIWTLILSALSWALTPFASGAQNTQTTVIHGIVSDEGGMPLATAGIRIKGTLRGALSDVAGRFVLEMTRPDTVTLRAGKVGYESIERRIILTDNDSLRIDLVMPEKLVQLEEAVVTASAFSTGDEKGVTLGALDVVTTPGAAADIFRAIQTFPGVVQIDDGAGLFVRGGDVTETVTILDQATVTHPYEFETPTGGSFGTIPPFLVGGTFFSAGGFSAKYGNALSGALIMKSKGAPRQRALSLNLGLAGASAEIETPIIDNTLGLRFSGNRNTTEAMFRLNGIDDDFTSAPNGFDGNLSLIYDYSPTGRVKLFGYLQQGAIGVRIDQPSFAGEFAGDETNALYNLQHRDVFGKWLLTSSLSLNRYTAESRIGNLQLEPRDITYKWRTDAERELSEDVRIALGAEIERYENRFLGEIPSNANVLDPQAEVDVIDEEYTTERAGGYAEVEAQLTRRLMASAGVRADHALPVSQTVVDPRFSLRYALSKHTVLRGSWGVYHQFATPYQYNATTGNPSLKAQTSRHAILGIERAVDWWLLRAEAYYKTYDNLVVEDNAANFVNAGEGFARGVDLFAKYGEYLKTEYSGWVSYSFLQSERTQARNEGGVFVLESAPTAFDVAHSFNLVFKWQFLPFFNAGFAYRYSSGRPHTPIVAARSADNGDFFIPVEGRVHSERLKDYSRLDLNLSYYMPFAGGNHFVAYCALSNALDTKNVIGYNYTADYSERTPDISSYSRFVYFGGTLLLKL